MTYSKSDIAEIVVAVLDVLESRKAGRTGQPKKASRKPKALAAKVVPYRQSKSNVSAKQNRSLTFQVKTANVFQAAGFADAKPNENVLTYKRWLAAGFRVKKGEKSHRVNGVPMFHKSQVETYVAA